MNNIDFNQYYAQNPVETCIILYPEKAFCKLHKILCILLEYVTDRRRMLSVNYRTD